MAARRHRPRSTRRRHAGRRAADERDRRRVRAGRASAAAGGGRLLAALRQPLFALGAITVDGDVTRNNAARRCAPTWRRIWRATSSRWTWRARARRSNRCRGCARRSCGASWPNKLRRDADEHQPVAHLGRRDADAKLSQQLRRSLRGQRRRRRGRQPAAVSTGPAGSVGAGAGMSPRLRRCSRRST